MHGSRAAIGFTLILSLFAGCATVGLPAVAVAPSREFVYEGGWGGRAFDRPTEEVRIATIEGMRDLQMGAIHQERSGPAWLLDARTRDGRHVRVAIQPTPKTDGSIVSARIGRHGDQPLARALTQRTGIRLGTLPPEAIPTEPPSSPSPGRFSRDAVPDAVMLPNPFP